MNGCIQVQINGGMLSLLEPLLQLKKREEDTQILYIVVDNAVEACGGGLGAIFHHFYLLMW